MFSKLQNLSFVSDKHLQKLIKTYFVAALYSVAFPNEESASFSNYRLWESLGFVIAYVYGNRICVDAKLCVIAAFLVTGMIGYLVVERKIRKNKTLR